MDGIEVLEPGDPRLERYRDADGRIYFYDLGATQHPSYTVNGFLVHNSSRLKGSGPLRKSLVAFASGIPYRLACTATPAPNDTEELINHSEFLGIRNGNEILAEFFRQDGNTTHKWRLKDHARGAFWKWLASWALAIRKPSDIGGEDLGFDLPALRYHQIIVEAPLPQDSLLQAEAKGIKEQRKVRRETMAERVVGAVKLTGNHDQPWVIWCDLNAESEALAKSIKTAVEVKGSHPVDVKVERLDGFTTGKYRDIVSKTSIAGYGMNWQHACKMIFCGLGNSWEQYYQGARRIHRFGQQNECDIFIITSEADGPVIRNIQRKEKQAAEMMAELVKETRELTGIAGSTREEMEYAEETRQGAGWTLHLGDSIKRIPETVESDSVGLCVYSPPFPTMYAYTNSRNDLGNCPDIDEMLEHYSYLVPELFRVLKPGRSCCVHLTQALAFLNRDGYVGMKDFRGKVIEMHQAAGFIYYGEATIDKNPQLKAVRTKDRGLLFKTLATDSSHMHMALADYLLQFRKPGPNFEPIRAGSSVKYGNPGGWITEDQWIRWARPVWYGADFDPDGDGISETDVLQNYREGKENEDEKHLCPLQLGVIERCIKLWSNPGDLVLSPFAGIGSEVYQALTFKRRAVGFELKKSYFDVACKNAERAEYATKQPTLFDDYEEA